MQKKLPSLEQNFSEWYQEVIEAAELADYGPVRGTMIIRPYAYALWEQIQKNLDEKIKEKGAENAYFPLFIPESFLKKEAQHVEGFSPELAVVTHAGGKELEEPLVVRPTSETIIYSSFAKWIKSWRDLPLKINQWANVVRWEMRTRLFLRTTEFLWQEGHTAHATLEGATEFAKEMQKMYVDFCKNYLAFSVFAGEKPESERFAGAAHTYTFEGMMQDGKALQMGTSHVLSQSFSRAFDILYQDKDGNIQTPVCTSWGSTTRFIGAIIMVHGDDRGLIMPPRIAPIQLVIVPIFKTDEEKEKVLAKAQELKKTLEKEGIRVKVDSDDRKTPGAKFYHWEVRGVPLRVEIGPRDLAQNHVVMTKRLHKDAKAPKQMVNFEQLVHHTKTALDELHDELYERAAAFQKKHTYEVDDFSILQKQLEEKSGFYKTPWCGSIECEQAFKNAKATIRCIVRDEKSQKCCVCKNSSKYIIIVAKAY